MLHSYLEHSPQLHSTAFVAPGAHLIGQVTLAEHSSVWFNAVLRGDLNAISVGRYSNIQDLSVGHVTDDLPLIIGDYVVVGHHAQLHGCTLRDRCLVGIGAIVLNGAVVSEECMVGAGALVPQKMVLEPGHLYLGSPAKKIRALTDAEKARIVQKAEKYAAVAHNYSIPVRLV